MAASSASILSVEDAEPAPTDEAVVDGFVRAVVLRCITPTQTVADDKDNTAQHTPVINPRNPVRKRKTR